MGYKRQPKPYQAHERDQDQDNNSVSGHLRTLLDVLIVKIKLLEDEANSVVAPYYSIIVIFFF